MGGNNNNQNKNKNNNDRNEIMNHRHQYNHQQDSKRKPSFPPPLYSGEKLMPPLPQLLSTSPMDFEQMHSSHSSSSGSSVKRLSGNDAAAVESKVDSSAQNLYLNVFDGEDSTEKKKMINSSLIQENNPTRILIKTLDDDREQVFSSFTSSYERKISVQMDIMRGRIPFLKAIDPKAPVDVGDEVTVLVRFNDDHRGL